MGRAVIWVVDPYQALGVAKDASADDIKRAFRKLAGENHPDKNPGNAAAEARFKEVNQAYQVLGDAEKKAAYDEAAAAPKARFRTHSSPFASQDFGFNFEDLFENVYAARTRAAGRTSPPKQSDANVEMKITISLEEAVLGCTKGIDTPSTIRSQCGRCGGSRAEPGTPVVQCGACGGSGRMNVLISNAGICPACKGRGSSPAMACLACGGAGAVTTKRHVTLKIPSGIDKGQKLRLPSMGNSGIGVFAPGDLYVEIDVAPHPVYQRDGLNLTMEHALSLVEVVRGGRIEVPTIDGKRASINVPPNVKPGATIVRAQGHGVKSTMRTEQGDLYVRLTLRIPDSLSPRATRLLDELADELARAPVRR